MEIKRIDQKEGVSDSIPWIGRVKFYNGYRSFGYITNILLDEDYYFTLDQDNNSTFDNNGRRLRLIQVAKEFRVGLNTLVNFLRNEGAEIDGSPNAIISCDVYALIRRRFGSNERR